MINECYPFHAHEQIERKKRFNEFIHQISITMLEVLAYTMSMSISIFLVRKKLFVVANPECGLDLCVFRSTTGDTS